MLYSVAAVVGIGNQKEVICPCHVSYGVFCSLVKSWVHVHQNERQISRKVSVRGEEVAVSRVAANLGGSCDSFVGVRFSFVGIFCIVEEVVAVFNAKSGVKDFFIIV